MQAQQNGGVVTLHVALGFGLQGNSTITSLMTSVALPPMIPSLSGGATPPFDISSLRLLHPPLSLALHCHPTMRALKTLKMEGSIIQKSCCIHNEEPHNFASHNSMNICH